MARAVDDTDRSKAEPAAASVETLELKKIRTDGGTQLRAKLSEKVIEEYAAAMREGHRAEFPPLVVFFDGTDYWLADGHHRYHAAQRVMHGVRYDTFDCEVHRGSRREAIIYAAGANATHGLRRTNADKHRAVTALLDDPEFGDRQHYSDRVVARMAAVSQPFVSKLRAKREHRGSDNGYRPGQDANADQDPDSKATGAGSAPTPHAEPRSGEKVHGPPAEFAFTVADSGSAEICREVVGRFAETLGGTSDQAFVSLCVAAKRQELAPVDAMLADDTDSAERPQ